MFPWYIIVIAAAAVLIWYFYAPKWKSGNREKQLEREYRSLLNLSEHESQQVIERQIESLSRKHPGKTREWYLEKMIYDLRRDR